MVVSKTRRIDSMRHVRPNLARSPRRSCAAFGWKHRDAVAGARIDARDGLGCWGDEARAWSSSRLPSSTSWSASAGRGPADATGGGSFRRSQSMASRGFECFRLAGSESRSTRRNKEVRFAPAFTYLERPPPPDPEPDDEPEPPELPLPLPPLSEPELP